MAALENQFKKRMDDSEKITIAIEKLPVKYQHVLTAEMRKEGSLLMAQHIKTPLFNIGGQCINHMQTILLFMFPTRKKKIKATNWLLQCSVNLQQVWSLGSQEAECYATKHINGQTLMPKNNSGGMGSNNDQNSKHNGKKKRLQENCNYCSKFGHKEADCRKKAADAKNSSEETGAVAV